MASSPMIGLQGASAPHEEPTAEGIHDLVHQFREFLIALWLSPGRHNIAFLSIGIVLVICVTAAAQVGRASCRERV